VEVSLDVPVLAQGLAGHLDDEQRLGGGLAVGPGVVGPEDREVRLRLAAVAEPERAPLLEGVGRLGSAVAQVLR
jgi:hypothetical protein